MEPVRASLAVVPTLARPTLAIVPTPTLGVLFPEPWELLVRAYGDVADAVTLRYRGHGVAAETLESLARDALVRAAHDFDLGGEQDFVTFALPLIRAAVKAFFRASGGRIDEATRRVPAPVIVHP